MKRDDVLQEFRDSGALLEGHFILSSGRRSAVYLQCARVLMHPDRAERLCSALAARVREQDIGPVDLIVSPAMGGVVAGYEMGRQLGVPAIFMERVDGDFALRRGFEITEGQRILIVEDVVTTGLSSRECIDAAARAGGEVVAEAALIDRSGGRADVGVPLVALATIDAPSYEPSDIPDELAAIEAVKPGSRGMA